MSQIHSPVHSLIDSEYQLIDTQRFKSEMRASRTALFPQVKANNLYSSGSQPISKYQKVAQSVELPISHSKKQIAQKALVANQEQSGLTVAANSRKEIEDVIYDNYHKRSGYFDPFLNFKREEAAYVQELSHKESRFKVDKQDGEINPFNDDYKREVDQMVSAYEKLDTERKRHKEVAYFKNKEKSTEKVQLDQLFEKYKESALRQTRQEDQLKQMKSSREHKQSRDLRESSQNSKQRQYQQKQETYLGGHKQSRYISIKNAQKEGKEEAQDRSSANANSNTNLQKQCILCKVSKLNTKQRSPSKSKIQPKIEVKPQHSLRQSTKLQDLLVAFTQSRAMTINASPKSNSKFLYFSSQDKKYFSRKNSIEPDQTWIEQGKLKKQYLRELQSRKNQQFQASQSPPKKASLNNSNQKNSQSGASSQHHKTPRRKIFSGIQVTSSNPYIKIESRQKQTSAKNRNQQIKRPTINHSLSGSKPPKPYKKIFTVTNPKQSLTAQNSKTITRQLNFDSYRQELVNSRVKIFRSKEKQHEASPGRNKSLIPGLRILQMSLQVRRWYQENRKEIVFQAERICSYDLINRYMTQQEVSSRLFNLVSSMVEPRRWVLLMVDEVYARLKDRYLPE